MLNLRIKLFLLMISKLLSIIVYDNTMQSLYNNIFGSIRMDGVISEFWDNFTKEL